MFTSSKGVDISVTVYRIVDVTKANNLNNNKYLQYELQVIVAIEWKINLKL